MAEVISTYIPPSFYEVSRLFKIKFDQIVDFNKISFLIQEFFSINIFLSQWEFLYKTTFFLTFINFLPYKK